MNEYLGELISLGDWKKIFFVLFLEFVVDEIVLFV